MNDNDIAGLFIHELYFISWLIGTKETNQYKFVKESFHACIDPIQQWLIQDWIQLELIAREKK